MKLTTLFIVLLIAVLASGYGFVQSGIFNVAATEEDGSLLKWLLHTTMEKSVEKRSQNIIVPDLGDTDTVLAGLSDYVEMCAQCHGEPGMRRGIPGLGLNPSPPALDELSKARTAAEQFWIVNNGIRMTGMPAFGKSHESHELWPVIAFLQAASDMTTEEYLRMKKQAQGLGHHAGADGGKEQPHHTHPQEENHEHGSGLEYEHDHQAAR